MEENLKKEEKMKKIKTVNDKIFKDQLHKNIIFIYTPPKVGSTSLVTSLRIHLIQSHNIIHIHDDIMLHYLMDMSSNDKGKYNEVTVNDLIEYNKNRGVKVWVINIYRSPIERRMSEYFEKLGIYHFNNTDDYIVNHPEQYSIECISDRFNNLFPHLGKGDHFFENYGIIPTDAEKQKEWMLIHPFDYNKKVNRIEKNGVTYLQLRLKDSVEWGRILSQSFGLEIRCIKDYETSNKAIGSLYKKFKDYYKLPKNYLEMIEKCPYFQYYYSEGERKEYLNEWRIKSNPINRNPYNVTEYEFYVKLYLENQYIPDIQSEHYKDEGCLCSTCMNRRVHIRDSLKRGTFHGGQEGFVIHATCVKEEKDKQILQQCIKQKISNEVNNISVAAAAAASKQKIYNTVDIINGSFGGGGGIIGKASVNTILYAKKRNATMSNTRRSDNLLKGGMIRNKDMTSRFLKLVKNG
jgi:hypothetical protein